MKLMRWVPPRLGAGVFGRARRISASGGGREIALGDDAFGLYGPAAVTAGINISSAASPPRSGCNVVGADAGVWLGRHPFRTDPRLAQIPTVAAFAPPAPAVWPHRLYPRASVTHTRTNSRARRTRWSARALHIQADHGSSSILLST